MKLLHSIAMTVLFSGVVYAQQDIELNGTTQYPLVKTSPYRFQLNAAPKFIRLLNVELSEKAWSKLDEPMQVPLDNSERLSSSKKLPASVQLGMNQVPVLDQGPYGTCVTFAVTAALDAASNQGDYISQLCQLELGQYLENNTHSFLSGWDGSFGKMVLNQIDNFGIVTKETQRTMGCAGLTAYPVDGNNPPNELNLQDYKQLSQSMSDAVANVDWSPIMDFYQAIVDNVDRNQLLMDVKNSLNKGDRLTFGVLLFSPEQGMVGAVGKHKIANDTWLITPRINDKINNHGTHGGHEMIITGYDDNAIATDENGVKYKGLLTLRNSWGKSVGNEGDFYMSYDYFKRLTVEVQRIRHLS